jgi:hypothetical protein
MAVSHIEKLRCSFPQHFVNQDPQDLEDSAIRIPTHEPDPARRDRVPADEAVLLPDDFREEDEGPDPAQQLEDLLAELPCDEPLEPISENVVGILGGYPGGPTNNPSGSSTGSTIIERLAFYLPFHAFPDWWGIYIFPEGIQKVRAELTGLFRSYGISPRDQVRVAKRLLYHHEFYHHAAESFATRIEAVTNMPCYLKGFSPLYKATFATRRCLEETCANSYAREKTIAKTISPKLSKSDFRAAIDCWFRGQPPGYAQADGTGGSWSTSVRVAFYEECINACLPLLGAPPRTLPSSASVAAWSAAGYFDRGIGDVRSRICYLIPKNSPFHRRLPADVRACMKVRNFKQKLQDLRIARFWKQGSCHERWLPFSGGGAPVPIPRHNGVDIPKGTMRSILRQLGCEMSIEQFLRA